MAKHRQPQLLALEPTQAQQVALEVSKGLKILYQKVINGERHSAVIMNFLSAIFCINCPKVRFRVGLFVPEEFALPDIFILSITAGTTGNSLFNMNKPGGFGTGTTGLGTGGSTFGFGAGLGQAGATNTFGNTAAKPGFGGFSFGGGTTGTTTGEFCFVNLFYFESAESKKKTMTF